VTRQMYCNDLCRESRREDRRAGLVAGFDRFTDEMAAERLCLYCRSYVPTHAERREDAGR
jgi:hypothetical protein